MGRLGNYLLDGDVVEFYKELKNYSYFNAMRELSELGRKDIQSLMVRLERREPMDFDLEARFILDTILLEVLDVIH